MCLASRVEPLCESPVFLGGSSGPEERGFDFEEKLPWKWRVVSVDEYLDAVTKRTDNQDRNTPWHILEERHLAEVKAITDRALSVGVGPTIDRLKLIRSQLGQMLSTDQRIRKLAD